MLYMACPKLKKAKDVIVVSVGKRRVEGTDGWVGGLDDTLVNSEVGLEDKSS